MRTAGKGSGGSVGDRSNRLSQYTLYVHLYIGLIDSSSIHLYTLYSIHKSNRLPPWYIAAQTTSVQWTPP